MPEYMDYNDYDNGEKTKRQKILSTISCILSAAFLIFITVWTFTHLPENVRTKYGPVYSSAHTIGEKSKKVYNEFLDFDKNFELDKTIVVDENFKEKYPKIFSLAKATKLDLAEKSVKTYDLGEYFVIATAYEVDRQTDANGNYYDEGKKFITGTVGVDFYLFKYSITDGFEIKMPERFSIRFTENSTDIVPTIQKVYVESDSFRLNFYSLSILVESKHEFNKVYTDLNLLEGINKEEFEKQFFIKSQFVKSVENQDLINLIETTNGGERGDKGISSGISLSTPIKTAEIGLNFEDSTYNKFSSFKVSAIKNATYKIKIN